MHSTHFAYAFSLVALAALGASAGCAAHPAPLELVDARAAYTRAQAGNASQSQPEELAEAKRFLDAAERWHKDAPGSEETRNLAYVAQRKVLTAEADARTELAQIEQAKDLQALAALRREQVADAHNRAEKAEDAAALAGHSPSSRRAKEALDRLSPFAAVSEGQAAITVSIADAVLFEGETAQLMGTARERLDRVVEALQQLRGRTIAVNGYMDASGDDARDADLSRRRAESVRKYIVSRGVARDRVRAVGLGNANPAASDASIEGRRQNRRVEIVVEGMEQAPATH